MPELNQVPPKQVQEAFELLASLNTEDRSIWLTYGKLLFIGDDDEKWELFADSLSDCESKQHTLDKIERLYSTKRVLTTKQGGKYVRH